MTSTNPLYVILVGAGKVGYYLSKELVQEGHEVLMMEKDRKVAERMAEELGEIVMHADGCEIRSMNEAGMGRANVVVAVTGDDEDNLVICQMAKRQFGVPRTIARVNDPKNEILFRELGIDQTVSSTRLIFNLIEQQIETGQVIPLASIKSGEMEIVEVDITQGSTVIGQRVSDLDTIANTRIISIIRADRALPYQADMKVLAGDTLIAVTRPDRERELRELFAGQQS